MKIRAMVIIMLAMASCGYGAYSNTPVAIKVGGVSSFGSGDGLEISSSRRTIWIEKSSPIRVSADSGTTTLTTIKCGWRARIAADFTLENTGAYMLVLRSDGSGGYNVIHRVDVTADVNAVKAGDGYYTITKSGLSLAVNDGDFLGAWCDGGGLNTTTYPIILGTATLTGSFAVDYVSATDITTFEAGDHLAVGTVVNSANMSLCIEAFASDNTKLVSNDATHYNIDEATYIPNYPATPYWIILEDVNIPDGEDFTCTLSQYTSAWANDDIYSFDINTTDLDITDGTATDTLVADTLSSGGNWIFNIYIWIDPANAKIELFYQNMRGSSLGTEDTWIYSLQSRIPADLTAGDLPSRISFTGTAGVAFDVDAVIVCQKPVLVLGDSFFSAYSESLYRQDGNRVGSQLDGEAANLWTEDRFVIYGGSSGSNWQYTGTARQSIFDRWYNGDACAMRDVVIILWPSVNDIELIVDTPTYNSVIVGMVGSIGRAAAEATYAYTGTPAYGVANDIIMAELIPQPSLSALQKQAITEANKLLRTTAYYLQNPFALTNAYTGGYSGVHPDAAGSAEIAQKIVDAYEDNAISPESTNLPFSRTRGF